MEIVLIIVGVIIAPFVLYFGVKLFWSIPKLIHWIVFATVTVILVSMCTTGDVGWGIFLVIWGGIWVAMFFLGLIFGFL
jgi:hypothetical protein